MKFKYKKYGRTPAGDVTRPVIPVTFIKGEASVTHEVLIDSGADNNFIDDEIAEILGIDVSKGKKMPFSGATGTQKMSYLHPLVIEVGGHRYETNVAFARGIAKQGYSMMGQIGFFDFFDIKFNKQKGVIEIKEYNKRR